VLGIIGVSLEITTFLSGSSLSNPNMSAQNNLNLFQNIGTILALVISIAALFVSIYEANLLKAQQRATVWPYVSVGPNYSSKGFSLIASNNGTGPAVIKSFELLRNGQAFRSYDELLDAIKPDRTVCYDVLKMRQLNNSVLKASEARVIFNMPWNEETREIAKNIGEIQIKVQYCSVFDDCWVYDLVHDTHELGRFKAAVEFGK